MGGSCYPAANTWHVGVVVLGRNVLVESARIARGNISPLSTLSATSYDAVVFPGGFGAAKNL